MGSWARAGYIASWLVIGAALEAATVIEGRFGWYSIAALLGLFWLPGEAAGRLARTKDRPRCPAPETEPDKVQQP